MTDHTFAPLPLLDSHAHLDMLADRGLILDEVVRSAFEAGLQGIISIACADKNGGYEKGLAAAATFPNVSVAAGIHPHASSIYDDAALAHLRETLVSANAVALGEIGLDFHYNYSTPEEQRRAFVGQIGLARELGLPVVVHTRNADADTIAILKGEGVDELGGVIHCFSSGENLAREALALGMYLSFSGIVTFPKSAEIQEIAKWAPSERILCETDSPFLAPAPKRGGINTPDKVRLVVEKVAALREAETQELATKIVENTKRCFRLS